jgi:hypothetical protein
MVAHACNSSTLEAGAGAVLSQLGLHSVILSQKNKQMKRSHMVKTIIIFIFINKKLRQERLN